MYKKYVVDTNVPMIANMATMVANQATQEDASIPEKCILACVKHIKQIIQNGGLVLDCDGDIFTEYRNNLSMSGQPGPGDAFIQWVHKYQYQDIENKVTRVKIHKDGDSYKEFPQHPQLETFDPSDRKFVAASNAHPDKPTILQAVDSKWWSYKDTFEALGISIHFLCPEYVKANNITSKNKRKRTR